LSACGPKKPEEEDEKYFLPVIEQTDSNQLLKNLNLPKEKYVQH
jgi:hypothetical protein